MYSVTDTGIWNGQAIRTIGSIPARKKPRRSGSQPLRPSPRGAPGCDGVDGENHLPRQHNTVVGRAVSGRNGENPLTYPRLN
jgi:hypothetical protein